MALHRGDRARRAVLLRAILGAAAMVASALAAAPAAAQTSSEMFRAAVPDHYFTIKRLLRKSYKVAADVAARKGAYSLSRCIPGGRAQLGQDADPLFSATVDLADEIVAWSADLAALGYPPSVWQPILVAYEKDQVPTLATQAAADTALGPRHNLSKLVEELGAHRAQNPDLPAVAFAGCGSLASSLKVVAEPPTASLYVIPFFARRLCAAQSVDPDDPELCDWWKQTEQLRYEASLRIVYQATWPDGAVRQGEHTAALDAKKPLIVRRAP